MASLPPSNCCAQGFKHTGESKGKLIDLNGIETYVVGDEKNSSEKFLLFLTDVIGHKFINAQLIADEFAKAGYFVVVPDLFSQDPVLLNPPSTFDLLRDWFPHHKPEITGPIVDKIVASVKAKWAPKYVVATGYCFGAKYAVRLLGSGFVQAAAIFHPSFVAIEEVRAIKGPLYIGASEVDHIFPAELRRQTEDALLEIKAQYRLTLNHGVEHGFSVRGDITDPWIKYAKERVFADAVDWFKISYEIAHSK